MTSLLYPATLLAPSPPPFPGEVHTQLLCLLVLFPYIDCSLTKSCLLFRPYHRLSVIHCYRDALWQFGNRSVPNEGFKAKEIQPYTMSSAAPSEETLAEETPNGSNIEMLHGDNKGDLGMITLTGNETQETGFRSHGPESCFHLQLLLRLRW